MDKTQSVAAWLSLFGLVGIFIALNSLKQDMLGQNFAGRIILTAIQIQLPFIILRNSILQFNRATK